jgi:hypothetical protein
MSDSCWSHSCPYVNGYENVPAPSEVNSVSQFAFNRFNDNVNNNNHKFFQKKACLAFFQPRFDRLLKYPYSIEMLEI